MSKVIYSQVGKTAVSFARKLRMKAFIWVGVYMNIINFACRFIHFAGSLSTEHSINAKVVILQSPVVMNIQ